MENAAVILTVIAAGLAAIVAGDEDACIGRTITLTAEKLKPNAGKSHDVDWRYQNENGDEEGIVYSDLQVYDRYKQRFAVQLLISGNTTTSTLIISNAQRDDSGSYTCTRAGFGESKTIKLSVSEHCDSVTTASSHTLDVCSNTAQPYASIVVLAVLLVLAVIAAIVLGCLWRRERKQIKKKFVDSSIRKLQSSKEEAEKKDSSIREMQPLKEESEKKDSSMREMPSLREDSEKKDEGSVEHRASGETQVLVDQGSALAGFSYIPDLKTNLSIDGNVCGVTQLDNKIYVICFGSGKIHVFDMNYKEIDSINVQHVKDPHDMVSCKKTGHLFICDCSGMCIWRVKFGSDSKPIADKLIALSDTSPRSLSVMSPSARLLIVLNNNRLRLVKSDGEVLEDVGLPSYMNPRHAVQSDYKIFIVSYTLRQPDSIKHHISVVNAAGAVLHTCKECICVPHHMALDADGRVLVADKGSGQVLLLSKDLKIGQTLLTRTEVVSPYRLSYDPESRRLLIGEFDESLAKVFILDPKQQTT